jgi:DNA-binding NarL/FixJ family response regulator
MGISLLVADDHQIVRSGLASLLDGSGIEIVGEASNGNEAVERTLSLKPDAVLMDIRMLEGDGLTAMEQLRDLSPATPVIVLSTYDNPTYIARSLALGARDYVLKGSPRESLVTAIERAVRGEAPAADSVVHHVKQAMERRKIAENEDVPLTNREMQVLRHLALGLTNRDIGQSLKISVETVKEHVQNILRKLKVTDRTQAAVWAVKQGFV